MKTSALRFWNIAKVGLLAISRNKMRSLLTMLGIIIGVACVITMVAVGTGASSSIQATINSLGSNFIMLFPGASTQGGARVFTGESRITTEDVDAIRNESPSVAYVSPSVRTSAQVVAGELNWGTSIYGVGVDWPFIRVWNVSEGDFFTDVDVRTSAKVAVLGATVAESLFPAGDAIGSSIRIKNVPFRVVGVLDRKGGNMMGQDQDDQIVAPYTTVMKQLLGQPRIGQVLISARSASQVNEAQTEIEALLRQRHRIPPGQESDFSMRSQEEIASTSAQTSRTLSILLGSAAAISLLVGGIGIMNIMLVSVTERTREIGIRLAIGAKGRHVLLQFLLEAVALSVVGGAIGVGLGLLVPNLVTRFAGMPTQVSSSSVLLAFGFAAAIGIFFGFYPARKASRLDPIDALRYE
ncbi:MAG TPA: ABC transporter permease [Thermoanaerobaculia bacterium]|jgi:putative ABC transport system permease protein|nr:ABC transporter permease [Thermoanaerobaculia bacterium]